MTGKEGAQLWVCPKAEQCKKEDGTVGCRHDKPHEFIDKPKSFNSCRKNDRNIDCPACIPVPSPESKPSVMLNPRPSGKGLMNDMFVTSKAITMKLGETIGVAYPGGMKVFELVQIIADGKVVEGKPSGGEGVDDKIFDIMCDLNTDGNANVTGKEEVRKQIVEYIAARETAARDAERERCAGIAKAWKGVDQHVALEIYAEIKGGSDGK